MLKEVEVQLEVIEQLSSLKDKMTRISKFLKELKTLSKSCQEIISSSENHGVESNVEAFRERQVFVRRILQLRAEIEDGRDLVLELCKSFLPEPQWRIIAEDLQEDCENAGGEADFQFGLSCLDIDPSVRFFGIDWESIFGKCLSLSLNANIFGDQILGGIKMKKMSNVKHNQRSDYCDLVLVNRILRNLASLQADVISHAEAVLQGRLSKSQRKLIRIEQLKYANQKSSTHLNQTATKPLNPVTKSRSLLDPNKSQAKSRQCIKYKQSKTTNLDKISTARATSTENNQINLSGPSNMIVTAINVQGGSMTTIVSAVPYSLGFADLQLSKKKNSFIQNVSSILKNIR